MKLTSAEEWARQLYPDVGPIRLNQIINEYRQVQADALRFSASIMRLNPVAIVSSKQVEKYANQLHPAQELKTESGTIANDLGSKWESKPPSP